MKKFEVKTKLDFVEALAFMQTTMRNWINRSEKFEPFDVIIEKHKESKTTPQLRGFWRLCEYIGKYLQNEEGSIWYKKRVCARICMDSGYVWYYNGIPIAKSVADATKEEMSLILSNLLVLGETMDIPDCTLTSKEEEAFNNYYK